MRGIIRAWWRRQKYHMQITRLKRLRQKYLNCDDLGLYGQYAIVHLCDSALQSIKKTMKVDHF